MYKKSCEKLNGLYMCWYLIISYNFMILNLKVFFFFNYLFSFKSKVRRVKQQLNKRSFDRRIVIALDFIQGLNPLYGSIS